ncbi:MAG: hypothetical protein OIF32_10595 [Campylobacterales bacterium]|nr:hypothetical protein [Campylobacterales bacterium]
MNELLLLVENNIAVLLFGIVMNLGLTFGFGIYKAMNLSYNQTVVLMDKYPVKTKSGKLVFLWVVPWLGVGYIFYELLIVQKYINNGLTVYDYIEHKLQREFKRQES